jgi:hypothetical protein
MQLLNDVNIQNADALCFDFENVGGHLLIVDFNKNEEIVSDMVHNGFDQVKLSDLMTKIGYKDIKSKLFISSRHVKDVA